MKRETEGETKWKKNMLRKMVKTRWDFVTETVTSGPTTEHKMNLPFCLAISFVGYIYRYRFLVVVASFL